MSFYIQGLEPEQRELFRVYHDRIGDSLSKFRDYLLTYNNVNSKKVIFGLGEAIRKWKISTPEFKKEVIDE